MTRIPARSTWLCASFRAETRAPAGLRSACLSPKCPEAEPPAGSQWGEAEKPSGGRMKIDFFNGPKINEFWMNIDDEHN